MISLLLRVTCIIFERANDTDVNGQAMVVRAIESQKTVVSHLKEARKGFSLLECPGNDGRCQKKIFKGVGNYISPCNSQSAAWTVYISLKFPLAVV